MAIPNNIRSVSLIDSDGRVRTIHRRKRKKKSQSAFLKPLETATRRIWQGVSAGADSYVDGHEGSNRKQKDGWIQDLGKNVFKASRKAFRKTVRGRED
jgi:hypothetical protein